MSALNIKPDGKYLDCTLGGGGHSEGILSRLNENGRLLSIDLDIEAINSAKERLSKYGDKIKYANDNFKNFASAADAVGIEKFDGILLDLGVSSYQIDNPERGFSYIKEAPLDMRMNRDGGISAADVVNGYSEKELKNIFSVYGEERYSGRIASEIVRQRAIKPYETTTELAATAEKFYPKNHKEGHPAKRIFQAVRIEVNGELQGLGDAIEQMTRRLNVGGRIAVITFHSLEDRIVKNVFRLLETDCVCDKSLPICVCGKKSEIKIITKKPITAGKEELNKNRRSASAKLRVAEKK